MNPIDILRRMTKPLTDEQVERQLMDRHGAYGRGNASQDMFESEERAERGAAEADGCNDRKDITP